MTPRPCPINCGREGSSNEAFTLGSYRKEGAVYLLELESTTASSCQNSAGQAECMNWRRFRRIRSNGQLRLWEHVSAATWRTRPQQRPHHSQPYLHSRIPPSSHPHTPDKTSEGDPPYPKASDLSIIHPELGDWELKVVELLEGETRVTSRNEGFPSININSHLRCGSIPLQSTWFPQFHVLVIKEKWKWGNERPYLSILLG